MRAGDLVRIVVREGHVESRTEWLHRRASLHGVVLVDHSPMRPPDVGRVVDVMWNNGTIEDMYTDELEVISEN